MKKKIGLKLLFAISILLISIFVAFQFNIGVDLNKQFFQGFLAGLSAIAAVIWLISLIKIYTERMKIVMESKSIFLHKPFLKSLGMFCLFAGILLIYSFQGISIYLISAMLFGMSIGLNIKALKKT